MTDLDDRLELLRADLAARIVPPPLTTAVTGSVDPPRRRLTAALVAAGVVAVMATGAVLARSQRQPNTAPASPNPASSTHLPSATDTPSSATSAVPALPTRLLAAADMADGRHGFALIQICRPDGSSCRVTSMSVTEDAMHWVQRAVPSSRANDGTTDSGGTAWPGLTVLGPRSVYYQAAPSGPGSGFFSSDAGVTWAAVPAGVNGTVASIPTNAVLQASCPTGGADPCTTVALTVRLPGNGQLVKLSHQPDIAVESANAAPLPDGSWWVSGNRGGAPALAVSRDQGRSWTSSLLPGLVGRQLFISSVTGAGGRLWALDIGQLPDVKNGLLGVYRSDDNGRSWVVAWKAKPGKQPRSAQGVGIAAVDRLVICDESQPQRGWASGIGGATFEQTTCPAAGWPQWSRVGYRSFGDKTMSFSPDGIHWTHTTP
jgi:hypothetical protein